MRRSIPRHSSAGTANRQVAVEGPLALQYLRAGIELCRLARSLSFRQVGRQIAHSRLPMSDRRLLARLIALRGKIKMMTRRRRGRALRGRQDDQYDGEDDWRCCTHDKPPKKQKQERGRSSLDNACLAVGFRLKWMRPVGEGLLFGIMF
jgi:hypothetical protein